MREHRAGGGGRGRGLIQVCTSLMFCWRLSANGYVAQNYSLYFHYHQVFLAQNNSGASTLRYRTVTTFGSFIFFCRLRIRARFRKNTRPKTLTNVTMLLSFIRGGTEMTRPNHHLEHQQLKKNNNWIGDRDDSFPPTG